ncbi:hypothetical protein GGP41_003499 [Bipolaris sorokiniana]|uniref:Uncharacterized protein n=2 Tax=Cochliobolus sativus TaxID=45130 RepID=A0A8H5ZFP6_COCSA|nr:uncharacterized protein COCSADRAFT_38556 [Bipolaris sorokiniana ND90Pr]EMD62683.1 hypothetical protein COCSADRAFT_38556 [Bipolaris sorokiniana ND90Pr]KAF5847205.1 hypothetical protein GGP41_003499 [Bipolaris sorokiniana]
MAFISRETFLKGYLFPLGAVHDFENAGGAAQLAACHPKEWTQADNVLDFSVHLNESDKGSYAFYCTTITSDKKLLAISTSAEKILVYDIASQELRETLEGTGKVYFRPSVNTKTHSGIADQTLNKYAARPAGYTLVSVSTTGRNKASASNQLILWDLDQHGRILDKEEGIDANALATKAINAIAPELEKRHEWTQNFIHTSTLHTMFAEALNQVATDYRTRHNTIFDDAQLGGFGSVSMSNDGRLFLYHLNNNPTQQGSREPEELPQVVVYDLDEGIELHRLAGHTDAIMWSAISPDSAHIASVSWDGSLRMYSVLTGELEWAAGCSKEQSWAGAFSSDSRFIAWSSKCGRVVQLYDVPDGKKRATFPVKLSDWCRSLQWHPHKTQLAFCAGKDAYVWDVLNGPDGKMLQHFQIDESCGTDSRMVSIQDIGWMDQEPTLYLDISEGTKIVYNTESNAKEIFRRPAGVVTGYVDGGMYGVFLNDAGDEYYISIDGDAKVRYWRRGIAASTSWWEKDPGSVASPKKTFPDTGKYVKITKSASKSAEKQ